MPGSGPGPAPSAPRAADRSGHPAAASTRLRSGMLKEDSRSSRETIPYQPPTVQLDGLPPREPGPADASGRHVRPHRHAGGGMDRGADLPPARRDVEHLRPDARRPYRPGLLSLAIHPPGRRPPGSEHGGALAVRHQPRALGRIVSLPATLPRRRLVCFVHALGGRHRFPPLRRRRRPRYGGRRFRRGRGPAGGERRAVRTAAARAALDGPPDIPGAAAHRALAHVHGGAGPGPAFGGIGRSGSLGPSLRLSLRSRLCAALRLAPAGPGRVPGAGGGRRGGTAGPRRRGACPRRAAPHAPG